MASDQSVAAAFQPCSATNQLSGDPYHGGSNLTPMYLKRLRQCGFRTEHGIELREFLVSPTCAPTCLYVPRVPPVLVYPRLSSKVLALYASSDKTVYCWEQERNHLLHSKEKLGSLYTKLFYCASKDNQTCVLKEETGGRGFSPRAVSSPNQASTICSLFHFQPLPLLCIMDGIVRNSFLMYNTKEETVSSYT